MEQIKLQTNSRDILGKGVKLLRRQEIMPVHLFGHGLKSLALQCETAPLERALAQAGETRLITLKVNDEKKARAVLVRKVQRESLTGKLLHVDFYEVKMEEKLKVDIPLVLVGKAPALQAKDNRLLQEINALTVESLPGNIPTRLEVNVSSLTEPGQAVRIKDIAVGSDITVLGDPEQVVVIVIAQREEKEEAKPAEEKPKEE